MTNLNSIKKKILKKDLKISVNDHAKLLADFFNGIVIQVDEEHFNEP